MKKNIISVIIFATLLGTAACDFKLNENDKSETSVSTREDTHENVQASDVSQNTEKGDSFYYVSDYDKEQSNKIYEELSDEERKLQIYTSKHVGYKNLTSDQYEALKKIKEQNLSGISEFQEMEAIGETNSNERLTVEDIDYIKTTAKEANNWYEVMDRLELKQKYPDYRGTYQTYSYDAYWLEGKIDGITLLISHYPSKGDDVSSKTKMELVMKENEEPEVLIDFGELEDGTKKTQDNKDNENNRELLEADLVECDTIKAAVVAAFVSENVRDEMIAAKSGSFDITTADSLSIPGMKNLEDELKGMGEVFTPPKTEGMTKFHVSWIMSEDGKIPQVTVEVQP